MNLDKKLKEHLTARVDGLIRRANTDIEHYQSKVDRYAAKVTKTKDTLTFLQSTPVDTICEKVQKVFDVATEKGFDCTVASQDYYYGSRLVVNVKRNKEPFLADLQGYLDVSLTDGTVRLDIFDAKYRAGTALTISYTDAIRRYDRFLKFCLARTK